MPKYLVVSWDKDEQQHFYDVIQAKNRGVAEQMVADVRDYVEVTDSFTVTEFAKTLKRFREEPGHATRAEFAVAQDSDMEFCRTCDANLKDDEGEGYDGECGACADKAHEGEGTVDENEGDDLCDICMSSGVQVSHTWNGKTVCVGCAEDEDAEHNQTSTCKECGAEDAPAQEVNRA